MPRRSCQTAEAAGVPVTPARQSIEQIAKPPECSAHGLRKAGAVFAAEAGAMSHELMAIGGWTSLKQAEVYTRKAGQRRLTEAAMGKIVGQGANKIVSLDAERETIAAKTAGKSVT